MVHTIRIKNAAYGLKALLLIALVLAAVAAGQPKMGVPRDAGWDREIVSWRAQHAVELQKPDGWLALAGLEWLQPGDNAFGSAKDNTIHLPASAPGHLGVLHLQG